VSHSSRRQRVASFALVFAFLCLLFASCSAAGNIDIDIDGSGRAELEIELSEVLVSYLRDLSASLGSEWAGVFDLGAIERHFAGLEGLTLLSASSPTVERLQMTLVFDDITELTREASQAEGLARAIRFSRPGEGSADSGSGSSARELAVRISEDTLPDVLALSPFAGTALSQYLLPPPEGGLSAAEYEEYLSWSFEEYASPAELERMFSEAVIRMRVRPGGRILSQSGGNRAGDLVEYRIPVLELLTLEEPMVYSLRFESSPD
jgi:hypothetical protein